MAADFSELRFEYFGIFSARTLPFLDLAELSHELFIPGVGLIFSGDFPARGPATKTAPCPRDALITKDTSPEICIRP